MNPRLKHVLVAAAGCQTVLMFVILVIGHGEVPMDIVMLISSLVQFPIALISALFRPRSPAISFVTGLALGLIGIVSLWVWFATNYRG